MGQGEVLKALNDNSKWMNSHEIYNVLNKNYKISDVVHVSQRTIIKALSKLHKFKFIYRKIKFEQTPNSKNTQNTYVRYFKIVPDGYTFKYEHTGVDDILIKC